MIEENEEARIRSEKKGSENFRSPKVLEIKRSQLWERLVSFSSMCAGVTTESHDVSNSVSA